MKTPNNYMFNLPLIRIIAVAVLVITALSGCSRRESEAVHAAEEQTSSAILHATTDAEFNELVLAASTPVLVDFWAAWCPPCRMMNPILTELANEEADTLRIVKVNTDDSRDLASRFNIRALPTLMLFRNGKAVAIQEGAMNKKSLQQWIQQQLGSTGEATATPAL